MEPSERESSESVESLLAGYVLGNLTPEEVAQVKQLLETDPSVAAEVDRLQATLALLPLSLPTVEFPPDRLEAKILQAAQNHSSDLPGLRPMRTPRWSIALGSIAALAIAAFGFQTYQLQQKLAAAQSENLQLQQALTTAQASLDQLRQSDSQTMRQQLSQYQQAVNLLGEANSRFLTLKGTRPQSASSGSLVISPKSNAALLVLRNVESLPPGKTYRMWAIMNGKKVTCTDFKPNEQGEVFLEIPLDQWGTATEVVVTLEPDRQLPQPVGEMVITGS
jgi:anti-sigma-K factor RskA